MLPEMRRKAQQLPPAEAEAILRAGSSGVLALAGEEGYPYALPISYVYHEGRLYFHCAPTGHKLDAVARCPKASFCVIAQDDVVPELYTTRYRSVIAFGTIRRLEDEQAIITALDVLGRKYAPGLDPSAEIAGSIHRVCVLEMTIDQLTGKEGIELTRLREKKQA